MQFGHTHTHNICPTQSVFHHILSLSCLSHSMFTSAIERSWHVGLSGPLFCQTRRIIERYPINILFLAHPRLAMPVPSSTLGNETGFENMIGRIRENWQCKLDTVIDVKQADFEPPGCPDSEDFCLPMNGMQRSRACSLFRPSCQTYETKRCMLSLWSDLEEVARTEELRDYRYNVRPPRQLSWFITPITMVMVIITIVFGAYKPTYNWGASHCRDMGRRALRVMASPFWSWDPVHKATGLEKWEGLCSPL